ncbi:hypothetical protein EJB05_12770, partial [Eragrostis curvula]
MFDVSSHHLVSADHDDSFKARQLYAEVVVVGHGLELIEHAPPQNNIMLGSFSAIIGESGRDAWMDACSNLQNQYFWKGNRPNTHLNAVGYSEVEKGFKERTGLVLQMTHMKNKWDKLKKDFKVWNKLMLKQTGCCLDSSKGTIFVDDEWWKKTRQEIPGCGKFRKLGLQNIDELQQCFADITNDVGGPILSYRGQCSTDVGEEEDVAETSPNPVSGKRRAAVLPDKDKKQKTGTALFREQQCFQRNFSVAKKDGKYTIKEVTDQVLACGAGYESNEY